MSEREVSAEQRSQVAATQEKVNRWLADFAGGYQVDSDGDTFLRVGSTRVYVSTEPFRDDGTVVTIYAWLLFEVPMSPELIEYVAFEGAIYRFGSLRLVRDPNNPEKGGVIFDHTLLGDYLDQAELETAVRGIALIGDELDTELMERFGGKTFYEDEDED